MTTLYLARHGETEENLARIFQGCLPGRLTERGREQAIEMGKSLLGVPIDCIVSSDLQRATDTVNLINNTLHLPVFTTPLLRERDWGEITGLKIGSVNVDDYESVETVAAMTQRAADALDYFRTNFPDKRILVVSHGLFMRCLRGVKEGKSIQEVERWQNCQVVRLDLC